MKKLIKHRIKIACLLWLVGLAMTFVQVFINGEDYETASLDPSIIIVCALASVILYLDTFLFLPDDKDNNNQGNER